MRRIKLEPSKESWWTSWRQACDAKLSELKRVAGPGKQFKIDDIFKDKEVKKNHFVSKKGPFRGRCAYCDADVTDNQRVDIEHYRPKKGVTDADDQPILVEDEKGKEIEHPGYWWLAYSDKNLLPSCAICNQATNIDGQKIGKHNRFPLEPDGTYAQAPSDDLEKEKPSLLNPLRDSPRKHLDVCMEDGDQFGQLIPLTSRGRTTVKLLALNLRDQLVGQRAAAIRTMKALYAEWLFSSDAQKERVEKQIQARLRGTESHTLASIVAFKHYRSPPVEVPED